MGKCWIKAINREFVPFLEPVDIALLVRLEIEEYTRREKLPFVGKPVSIRSITDFTHIEKAIAKQDIRGTAIAMNALLQYLDFFFSGIS